MNVIKWIRGWFRSPTEEPTRTKEQQAAYEDYVKRLNAKAPLPPFTAFPIRGQLEPSHGFEVNDLKEQGIPRTFGLAEHLDKQMKLSKVMQQVEETKASIANAKQKKKRVSHLYDRLIALKAEQIKLEGKK